MFKSLFSRILRYAKHKSDFTTVISTSALIISLVTMYYQFFNVKHELLYTFLFPSVGEKLEMPMVYKNTGNQNEIILDTNIELEIIPDDGTENYYKRIGEENKKLFPLIIAPGEYKVITLLGDYKEYFKGMLEHTSSGVKYREIVNLDTLSLALTTKFISDNGISEVRRHVGKMSFRRDKTFDRIDFLPVKLIELEPEEDREMTGGSIINAVHSDQITSSDSLTSDQIERIKFMISVVENTTIRKEMIKLLRKNGIKYPK